MVIVNLELTTGIGLGGFDALPEEQQARALGWAIAKTPAPTKPPEETAHERVLKKFRERGFK